MKLSDLIPGYHIVQTRNKQVYLVMLSSTQAVCLARDSGWISLNSYESDMMHNELRELDIVEIFRPRHNCLNWRVSLEITDSIYNAEEARQKEKQKELTVDQVSELLGYKVKIIGDK